MDNGLMYVAIFIAGILTLFACAALTPGARLTVAAALIIPQIYIPGLPLPLADIWIILMGGVALADKRLRVPKNLVLYLVFCLGAIYLLAHLWSPARFDMSSWMLSLRIWLYGTLLCYAYTVSVSQHTSLRASLRLLTPWILVQALLTFLFRFSTSLESAFLKSSLGQLFVGPSARDLFSTSPNNVLDPEKSGGFFVNGNVASMFGGVAAFVLLAVAYRGWSKWYYAWAAVAFASVIATGSKTGVALAIVLPVLWVVLTRGTIRRKRSALIPLAAAIIPTLMILPSWIESAFPSFSDRSIHAYGTRLEIWDAAGKLFQDAPLLGLGHGGWTEFTAGIPGVNGFPPHNILIMSWATAGLLAALLVAGLIFSTLAWCVRQIFNTDDRTVRVTFSCALCGFLWIYIHGMGDNTTVYGEPRTMILAVILFALCWLPVVPLVKPTPSESTHNKSGLTLPT